MQFSAAPYIALVLNALVWGLSWWPFQTMQAAGLAAPWATALMFSGLALGISVWAPSAWAVLANQRALWLLALTSGLTNVCFNTAVSSGDVVRVILLFYLMPAWAVLLAWRFLGERPSVIGIVRLVLAFAGMALIIVPPDVQWQKLLGGFSVPDALGLLGGFFFAATSVGLRGTAGARPAARLLAMFVGCSLVGGVSALVGYSLGWLPGVPALSSSWLVWVVVMALGVAAGNWSLQFGAARLPSATTALVMLSEVLFATLSAWLLDATELSARTLLGGALIVGGAALAALPGLGKRSAPAQSAAVTPEA